MTATKTTGASSTVPDDIWSEINWPAMEAIVLRLQMRIAKAEREGKRGKVRALQRLLTTSFAAKCLAVKRVTSSQGKNTPGVDGEVWQTSKQKTKAIFSLKRKGYKPKPLRRIYIPKKSGDPKDLRPLSIPCISDRAIQGLYLLSLEPLVEEWADPNAYGFRLKRSCHDAIEQCFLALGKSYSAQYILETDIKACFDRISHEYLLKEIPMDKIMLRKFLKSGFMEKNQLYPTTQGVPQGGVCSAALAVMALSGIEKQLHSQKQLQRKAERINMIAYADDSVITAASKELLTDKVIPILTEAFAKVGLELSSTKTKITHINDGFDFLGFNVRKYKNGKLLIKPAKANVQRFLKEIKMIIRKGVAWKTEDLIHTLNRRLTGWVNYYRSSVASKVFAKVDHEIYCALMRMLCKRHARKGKKWMVRKYFTTLKGDRWRFFCTTKDKKENSKPLYLNKAMDTKIRRHTKVKSEATAFNPLFKDYFKKREEDRKLRKTIINFESSAGLRTIQPY